MALERQLHRGLRVLILGLGRYPQGSGSSAARYFATHGAEVTVTDMKGERELAASVRRLGGLGIRFVLGRHRLSDVDRADLVLRNPGVRRDSPMLARARAKGIEVTNDVIEFMRRTPATVVGVTGTRGKSTTSALVAAALEAAGRRVWLGGNIKVSPLSFADRVRPGDVVVLELSSWMLEEFPERQVAPHVAVMTNLLRDHLNTYDSMGEYGQAKAGIFAAQKESDVAILGRDQPFTRRVGRTVAGRRVWTSARPIAEENAVFLRGGEIVCREDGKETRVLSVSSIRLPGEHNAVNALSAVAAARAVGVPFPAIRRALRTFAGLPDRMETVRDFRGVRFVNDTTATTPDAAIAALRSLPPRRAVLICGGTDKELEFGAMAREIRARAKSIVLLPGTATGKLKRALGRLRLPVREAGSMAEAVAEAASLAGRGDVVLLSPGAASFGLFVNEFDRGDRFREAVRALGKRSRRRRA